MKIKMIKGNQERFCQESEQELLESAGWTKSDGSIKTVEEQLVLKPPAKSKGAAKETLDNANQQGDE
jgi:hypothetical protein